jgi:hypothetical protein
MTERRPARSPRSALLAWCGAALAFLAVLALLSWQVAAGRDPAIGAGEPAAAPAPAKRVLVRRILRRVIVTDDGARPTQGPTTGATMSPPVPAPAPAPAPPTTRAS